MDDQKHRKLSGEFKRKRHLRTVNPFCRICGKAQMWANYHRHHTDFRAYSDDMIFICEDCHNEVHAMLREFPTIPSTIPTNRHRLIHMARGQQVIAQLSLKKWAAIEEWLLNEVDLPAAADVANDNGDEDPDYVERPNAIAAIEARFGFSTEEDSQ